VREAAASIQKEIQTDPYNAVRYDRGVQAAAQKYADAVERGASDAEVKQLTSTMMSAVLQAQRKQGVPEALITVASETQAATMKAEIEDARGQERFALIEKYRREFGNENMRYVRRQLKSVFKTSPRMAAMFSLDSNNPDARAVAATLDVRDDQLIKTATGGLDVNVRKSIQAGVRDNKAMKNFVKSMLGTSQNLQHVAQMGDLAAHAASVFVMGGMSEDAAVNKAVNAFMSPFAFVETNAGVGSTLRIPADKRPKSTDIVDGTMEILNPERKIIDLSKASFDPRAKDVQNPEIARQLFGTGKWMATPTGAQLMSSDGKPVFINGKPVSYTWDQLAKIGANRAADPMRDEFGPATFKWGVDGKR
jgi:hypothetical protein